MDKTIQKLTFLESLENYIRINNIIEEELEEIIEKFNENGEYLNAIPSSEIGME